MSIEQAQQVKITATNIKSSLISGNKKLQKIRIAENNFLKKIESDRRKRRKIAAIGKAFKPLKTIGKKLILKPGGSLFSKIMDFFSIMITGILIKSLPQLLNAIKAFFDKIGPFLEGTKNVLVTIGTAVGDFLEIFNQNPVDLSSVQSDKNKIESDINELNKVVDSLQPEGENILKEAESNTRLIERDAKAQEKLAKQSSKPGKDGKPTGVELSKGTATEVRQELQQGRGDHRDGAFGNMGDFSEKSPTFNPNIKNYHYSEYGSEANQIMTDKLHKKHGFYSGGTVGGFYRGASSVVNDLDSFRVFEKNELEITSNLKSLENNVELFKDFGNGLIGASSLSSSSPTSSASSFSLADSTSGLPIVGRVGSTGESTGPHVHIQRFPQPTNWQRDHITKDHPVMNNILVGGKPLNEWTFTSPASPDRWGSPHYGPDFGGDGINNQPIQLTGGITYDSSSLYQQSAGPEGNNILFTYNGEQFVIFHLNSGPESKSSPGMGGMLKGVVPTRLQRGNINVDMDEEYVYMLQQHLLSVIT